MTSADTLPDALPAGYISDRVHGAHVIVQETALPFVRDAIAGAGGLYDYAAAHPEAETIQGRGRLYVIPGPGSDRWVVRHLTHGGMLAMLAPLTGDRFVRRGTPRPFNELLLAAKLNDIGIRTPEVVAAAVYPSGLLYRGEMARTEVTGALDLAACLFADSGLDEARRHEVLAAAGQLVASLHLAGVAHPDLNLRNILIELGEGAPRAVIIDLEKCTVVPELSRRQRRRMIRRFGRSARRFEESTGRRINLKEWETFRAAYGARFGSRGEP
jgi:3-deoxy-D-manno-octulosonic acid kinase